MKLGIMQPYFFPYLGYFDLINQADAWIAFDTPQYMRHQWVNRNRILHPNSGWQYITVPIKKHRQQIPINLVEIANSAWHGRILRQLQHYKNKAPYYQQVIDFLSACFAETSPNLSATNILLLQKTCQHLAITTPIHTFSQMNLMLEDEIKAPGDWALSIAQAVGAAEYINPPGGAELFDAPAFQKNRIKLTIQAFTHMVYTCQPYEFEPGLSIIDVMMWNSRESIKHYLDTFRQTTLSLPAERIQ